VYLAWGPGGLEVAVDGVVFHLMCILMLHLGKSEGLGKRSMGKFYFDMFSLLFLNCDS
jgi:hypothetical protein